MSDAAPAAEQPVQKTSVPRLKPPEPPDGKWLTDEQGRQYFVDEIAKKEGAYVWLNSEKTRVQVAYGALYDVVGEDEDSFRVKIYRVEAGPPPAAEQVESPEAVAASYRNETGKADRLRFEAYGRGLPDQGQWRNGFELADMNGDGHLDIVHGPARKGERVPNIFLGDGKGNWRRWSEVKFPRLPYDYGDVAVADLNGDGRLDLALAIHLRGLIALVADGPESFKEWGEGLDFRRSGSNEGEGFSSRAVEAADMNGDGRPDLIALGEGPRMPTRSEGGQPVASESPGGYGVVLYFNQGNGSWKRADELAADRVRVFGDKLAVADFTNDGVLDIVIGSNVMGASEILRIGTEGGAWKVAGLAGMRGRSYVGAVAVDDFNGDKRADLAVGYLSAELKVWRTGIDVFLGQADGGWKRRAVAVEENRNWLTALDSGDLDGDGVADLAALTGAGETWLFLGKGDGSFLREETPEIPTASGGCKGYDVKIANLDGEPGGEIVAAFAGEASALFAPDLCAQQGALTAWAARRKS